MTIDAARFQKPLNAFHLHETAQTHAGASLRGGAGGRTRGHACDRMKLLVDMNLSPRWIDGFAGVGIDGPPSGATITAAR